MRPRFGFETWECLHEATMAQDDGCCAAGMMLLQMQDIWYSVRTSISKSSWCVPTQIFDCCLCALVDNAHVAESSQDIDVSSAWPCG